MLIFWAAFKLTGARHDALIAFAQANNGRELAYDEAQSYIPSSIDVVKDYTFTNHAYEYTINGEKIALIAVSKPESTFSKEFVIASYRTEKNYPHIFLDGLKNLPSNQYQRYGQRISLEGNFDDYFHLFAPAGAKSTPLAIITPDIMQTIIDSGSRYDIEINQRLVSVIANGKQFTQHKLPLLVGAMCDLIAEIKHKDKTWRPVTASEPYRLMLSKFKFKHIIIALIALQLLIGVAQLIIFMVKNLS